MGGRETWWQTTLSPLHDEKGEVYRIVGNAIPICRRKDELAEERRRLELVIQASNTGIWEWNVRTNRVHFSPRWKLMVGYADDELENEFAVWERLLHPDDSSEARQVDFADARELFGIEPANLDGLARDLAMEISANRLREQAEAARQIAEHARGEKEVLLREIHHRVKNNLQLIMSLLRLHISRFSSPEVSTALEECENKIFSIRFRGGWRRVNRLPSAPKQVR